MNSLGKIFKVSLYGSSHGTCVGVLIQGCPSGISIDQKDFSDALARRKSGKAGTTMRRENDIPDIQSGLYNGKTTGAPINIVFAILIVSLKITILMGLIDPGHAEFYK